MFALVTIDVFLHSVGPMWAHCWWFSCSCQRSWEDGIAIWHPAAEDHNIFCLVVACSWNFVNLTWNKHETARNEPSAKVQAGKRQECLSWSFWSNVNFVPRCRACHIAAWCHLCGVAWTCIYRFYATCNWTCGTTWRKPRGVGKKMDYWSGVWFHFWSMLKSSARGLMQAGRWEGHQYHEESCTTQTFQETDSLSDRMTWPGVPSRSTWQDTSSRRLSLLGTWVQEFHLLDLPFFFCPSPLPFGGSTVLSLTRGPGESNRHRKSVSITRVMPLPTSPRGRLQPLRSATIVKTLRAETHSWLFGKRTVHSHQEWLITPRVQKTTTPRNVLGLWRSEANVPSDWKPVTNV